MIESIVETLTNLYLHPILLPVVAAILVLIVGVFKEDKRLLGLISTVFLGATLYSEYLILNEAIGGTVYRFSYYFDGALSSQMIFEPLGSLLMLLFTFVGFAVSIYSIGYLKEGRYTEYYTLLLLMVTALNGIAVAGDIITLFVFYELLGITAYVLVAYFRNREAIEAAIKYLVMGATGTAFIIIGVAIVYGITGTFNLELASSVFKVAGLENSKMIYFALALFVLGFGVKAAIFPVHVWLPDAHPAAPSGISAMLSGVVIKAGLIALLKVLISFYYGAGIGSLAWPEKVVLVFMIIAAITITVPNFAALVQKDMKRLLAYSSVYNMGMIFAGLTVGTTFALAAMVLHIISHALGKALLFTGSGAFIEAVHTRNVDDMKGIGYKMPFTGAMFSVGAMSLAAFPPMIGFWSKFLLVVACIQAGANGVWAGYVLAVVIALNAIVSVGYYFIILVRTVWLQPEEEMSEKVKEAKEHSVTILVGEALLFGALILISIFPTEVFNIIMTAVTKFVEIYA